MNGLFDVNRIQVSETRWGANAEKALPGWDGTWQCIVCNRPVLVEKATWVECVAGRLLAYPQDATAPADHTDQGYMGCHPVGSTCARKIPKRYHVTR